tara:strand:- start:21 stop:380 length:360 start_codon:yes stop_codon:yes gene_type:complete
MTTTISGSNGIVFPDATSMQTGQQAVKAWVNFNGTGTVAIRDSYNVSSITDNAVGTYTINFTAAMSNNNYATCATGTDGNYATTFQGSFNQTTSAVKVLAYYGSSAYDISVVSAAIFSN